MLPGKTEGVIAADRIAVRGAARVGGAANCAGNPGVTAAPMPLGVKRFAGVPGAAPEGVGAAAVPPPADVRNVSPEGVLGELRITAGVLGAGEV